MFESFSLIPVSIKYNRTENTYLAQYKIVDDDFETVWGAIYVAVGVGVGAMVRFAVAVAVEIINCYESRGLNVAANFILYMQYCQKQNSLYTIKWLLELNEKYNPKYLKYKEDIKKLLVLI